MDQNDLKDKISLTSTEAFPLKTIKVETEVNISKVINAAIEQHYEFDLLRLLIDRALDNYFTLIVNEEMEETPDTTLIEKYSDKKETYHKIGVLCTKLEGM